MVFFDPQEKWDHAHILLYVGVICILSVQLLFARILLNNNAFYVFGGCLVLWLFFGLMPITWAMIVLFILMTIIIGYMTIANARSSSKSSKKKKYSSLLGRKKKSSSSSGLNLFNWLPKKKSSASRNNSLLEYYRRKYR